MKNKKKIIGLILIICIVLLIAIILINKNNNSNILKNPEFNNTSEEILKNISSEYTLGKEGKFILKLTNKNNVDVFNLNVKVEFYKENELLGNTIQNVYMIEAKEEYIIGMFSYINDEKLLNEENIKITIESQEKNVNEIDNSKVEIKSNEENGILNIEAKNSSEKTANLQLSIVYYNGDQIVSASEWNDIIEKKQSKTKEIKQRLDILGSKIEFDNYKIFYNSVLISE